MPILSTDFKHWLTTRLNNDPTINFRCWESGRVPQGVDPPYTLFNIFPSPDATVSEGIVSHNDPLVQVLTVGYEKDEAEIREMADAADALCQSVGEVDIPPRAGKPTGLAVRGSHREMEIDVPDNKEVDKTVVTYLQVGGRYRFMIHSVPQ